MDPAANKKVGDTHRDPGYKLKEFEATAVCGNDITSSCLYVSALTILQAGRWAPVALLIVAAVLYLYRKIYAEVVGYGSGNDGSGNDGSGNVGSGNDGSGNEGWRKACRGREWIAEVAVSQQLSLQAYTAWYS